ncbi:hypothetical protein ACGFZL_12600 [Streptomyces sp. NPDC048182]|uniref:DUF7144 family membrane protein n=1 Tax=unclassified Streptomyces TaxID=2593676 RepID=UPI0033A11F4E
MSQHAAPSPGTPGTPGTPSQPLTDRPGGGWVTGGVVFAGVLMVLNGAIAVLEGVAAIAGDDVYARVGTYVYELNLTGWGVIHVVIGALVLAVGFGLLAGLSWARYAGIFMAAVSLVAQFLFLPYAPVWAVITMAIDVFIIWALASSEDRATV